MPLEIKTWTAVLYALALLESFINCCLRFKQHHRVEQ